MSSTPTWLKRLDAGRSGLWSIIYPAGCSFQTETLVDSAPRDVETAIIRIVIVAGSPVFRYRDLSSTVPDFRQLLTRCERDAADAQLRSIRVVIGDFHEIPMEARCALIKSSRGIQETSNQISWQFVFCGQWSYYAFRAAYLQTFGHTNSPPAQSRDVILVPSVTADDVLRLLAERRLTGAFPSEIERITAEFLVEQTAGDEFLIAEILQHLEHLTGNWTTNVEQVIDELSASPNVIEVVASRLKALDAGARTELDKLLKVHRLIRSFDSIEAEQLWLAGFARRRDLGSGKQCVHLAGPLINTVLRRLLNSQTPGTVALPEDLCFERDAIATAAYRKVSQIEIMLRNLVVAHWHTEVGETWQDRLGGIKTLSRDNEQAEDVSQLVSVLFHSHLVASGLAPQEPPKPDAAPAAIQPRNDRQKESLLDSASDWQKRQRNHHAIELSNYNLMQFLTTEALMSVLVNKRDGLHGPGKPFSRKEYLVTALEEYIAIRSAVAHNQAIKLSTISRLDDLHRRFVEWLSVYADQTDPKSATK